jgi:hypothetical protein
VFFGLCALAGALILVGSAQPGFELYLNASTGTGDARRSLGPGSLSRSSSRLWSLVALASLAWSLRDYE